MPSILIVDDTAFMRFRIKDLAGKAGLEIAGEAKTGAEAVQLYGQLKPDLVTMDITMPEMDGMAALKEIMKADSEAKVIMCSAIASHSTVIDAIMTGASDFIIKPIDQGRFAESVRKILNLGENGEPVEPPAAESGDESKQESPEEDTISTAEEEPAAADSGDTEGKG